MLRTKCIMAPVEENDGFRLCVMSWLTNDKGEPIEDFYKGRVFHDWPKIIAPNPKYVGPFKRKEITWEEFSAHYFEKLRKPQAAKYVQLLSTIASIEDLTLLCSEATPEHCHRSLLAEECKKYRPDLAVYLA
jgi:uncharacterized protein YeaO (DUF488 family)